MTTDENTTRTRAFPADVVAALTAPEPVVAQHRYPWRTQEFAGVAILLVVPFVIISLMLREPWWWGVIGPLSAAYLIYVGRARKAKSALTATWSGSELTVASRGPVKETKADLTNVGAIGCRKYGADESLLLAGGTSSVRVPERLLAVEPVRTLVQVIVKQNVSLTPEARAVLKRAGLTTP